MSSKSKTEQLVKKLFNETKSGNIKWDVCETPRSLNQDTEQSVPLFLKSEYKGKHIGVYDLRTKHFYDEHEFYWSESIGLCIVDDRDRVVWEANEYFPALLDLFNTAREKAAGLDDILNDLI
jgi:hypothetical protein